MRTLAACLLALVCIPAAHAEDISGLVRYVYYEAARGVMVDARMRPSNAQAWADVELADRRRVLVQVPREMTAYVGDLVTVRLGEPKSSVLASINTVNRVSVVRPPAQVAGPAR